MICAPSNCAIDEVIRRIKFYGLVGKDGKKVQPKLVRVGILEKNTLEIIQKTSLDYKVGQLMYNLGKKQIDEELLKKELKRIRK